MESDAASKRSASPRRFERETVMIPRRGPSEEIRFRAIPPIVTYIVLNIALNFLNKTIFTHHVFNFPLTIIQSNMTCIAGVLGLYLWSIGEWRLARARLSGASTPVILTGLAHSFGIAFENAAIVQVSLATNQIIKSLSPVLVLGLSRVVEGRRYSWRVGAATAVLCLGAALTLLRSPDWNTLGVVLSFASALFGAVATVLSAIMVSYRSTKREPRAASATPASSLASSFSDATPPPCVLGAERLVHQQQPHQVGNPSSNQPAAVTDATSPSALESQEGSSVGVVAAAFATSLVGALGLFPVALAEEGRGVASAFATHPLVCAGVIAGTFVVGLSYTLTHFWLISATGSVYSSAVGILKTALLVAISVPVFHTKLHAVNAIGVAVAMVGFALFAMLTKEQLAGRVAEDAGVRDKILSAVVASQEGATGQELAPFIMGAPSPKGLLDDDDDGPDLDEDIVLSDQEYGLEHI